MYVQSGSASAQLNGTLFSQLHRCEVFNDSMLTVLLLFLMQRRHMYFRCWQDLSRLVRATCHGPVNVIIDADYL